MPGRGAKFRAVALGAAGAVVLAVLAIGVLTVMLRRSGPPERLVSTEGGMSIEVPKGWTTAVRHPTGARDNYFLSGRENGVLGFLQRGGFWIARWPAANDFTLNKVGEQLRQYQGADRHTDWSMREQVVAHRRAVVARWSEPASGWDTVRLGKKQIVVREFLANGYVVQLGTWAMPHPGAVASQLRDLAESLELFPPRPWLSAHLTLPGGWIQQQTKLKGAVFFGLAPGDPVEAWAYVFHYHDAPASSLQTARKNIAAHGGAITGQAETTLGGRNAVRLDFRFPDGDFGDAHDVEWFVSDGNGGTFVLAVGRRAGVEDIHERLARSWRF